MLYMVSLLSLPVNLKKHPHRRVRISDYFRLKEFFCCLDFYYIYFINFKPQSLFTI